MTYIIYSFHTNLWVQTAQVAQGSLRHPWHYYKICCHTDLELQYILHILRVLCLLGMQMHTNYHLSHFSFPAQDCKQQQQHCEYCEHVDNTQSWFCYWAHSEIPEATRHAAHALHAVYAKPWPTQHAERTLLGHESSRPASCLAIGHEKCSNLSQSLASNSENSQPDEASDSRPSVSAPARAVQICPCTHAMLRAAPLSCYSCRQTICLKHYSYTECTRKSAWQTDESTY